MNKEIKASQVFELFFENVFIYLMLLTKLKGYPGKDGAKGIRGDVGYVGQQGQKGNFKFFYS